MKQTNLNTAFNSPLKFYLTKNKKYQKYYVIISKYDAETKKTVNKYKSLKTNNKQIALQHFNNFVNNYNNNTEIVLNRNITFEDFYKEITNQLKANLSKNTISIYNLTVRKFIEIIGNKMLRLIAVNDIEKFKEIRLSQNVSKFEVNKELSTLKAILNIAIKLNYLNKNVCKYVKKYCIIETKIKIFSDIEIELLLNNIANKTLLNIVKFGLYSGLRLNEILNLQICDIDFVNETISISNKENFTTKNKRNKTIILNDKLKNLLSEVLNQETNIFDIALNSPDKYLFVLQNRNTAINKDYISHIFKKELRKLNLNEDLHFHSLRHTYISNLINKGTPINFVKELVQHSSINTTMKYITLNQTELKKYANI